MAKMTAMTRAPVSMALVLFAKPSAQAMPRIEKVKTTKNNAYLIDFMWLLSAESKKLSTEFIRISLLITQ